MSRSSLAVVLLLTGISAPAVGLQTADRPTVMVSTDWVSAHLDDPDVLLVHVLMSHDGAPDGFIPGAVALDYHSIEDSSGLPIEIPPVAELEQVFSRIGVAPDRHVVVYGPAPAHLAARAFVTLEVLGHERVSLLDGGIGAWVAEGRATSRVPADPEPRQFTARIDDTIVVSADWIAARLDEPDVAILDARPRGQFEGSTMAGLRDGHIPGAGNVFYGEFLESEEVHRLRPEDEVRQLLRGAGVEPGDTVVSYCQIGMRASYNYVVARHLGHDVKLYDGSWAEWGRRADLPAEVGPGR